jgi:hypothetical protein
VAASIKTADFAFISGAAGASAKTAPPKSGETNKKEIPNDSTFFNVISPNFSVFSLFYHKEGAKVKRGFLNAPSARQKKPKTVLARRFGFAPLRGGAKRGKSSASYNRFQMRSSAFSASSFRTASDWFSKRRAVEKGAFCDRSGIHAQALGRRLAP